jgi:hypothetical protein
MSSTIRGQLLGRIPRDSICYMVVCIILIYLIVEVILTNKYTGKSGEVDEFKPTCKTRSWSQEAFTMSSQQKEPKICGSVVGHLPETYGIDISKLPRGWGSTMESNEADGKTCKMLSQGSIIESLDDIYNFRWGWALKYVKDVEDKHHLLPWLHGNRVDLNLSKRRVYLDLGANSFKSSIQWFMQMYPCDFTEVHAFRAIQMFLNFLRINLMKIEISKFKKTRMQLQWSKLQKYPNGWSKECTFTIALYQMSMTSQQILWISQVY